MAGIFLEGTIPRIAMTNIQAEFPVTLFISQGVF